MVLDYSNITAVTGCGNRFTIFALGKNRQVSYKMYDNSVPGLWTNWTDLPGNGFTSSPCAVAWPDTDDSAANQVDVFVLNGNELSSISSQDGISWQGWSGRDRPPSADLVSQPFAVAQGPQKGDRSVFVLGSDGHIYTLSRINGNWQQWDKIPGSVTFISPPCAVARGKIHSDDPNDPSRIDVFAVGKDNRVYRNSGSVNMWQPNWELLEDKGVQIDCMPCAVAMGKKRVEVIAVGTDPKHPKSMYSKRWDEDAVPLWQPPDQWDNHGGTLDSPISLASWASRPEVPRYDHDPLSAHYALVSLVNGNDLGVKAYYGDGAYMYPGGSPWLPSSGGWITFSPPPDGFIGSPCALAGPTSVLHIFALGGQKRMYYKSWDGIKWYPDQDTWKDLGGEFLEQPTMCLLQPTTITP